MHNARRAMFTTLNLGLLGTKNGRRLLAHLDCFRVANWK